MLRFKKYNKSVRSFLDILALNLQQDKEQLTLTSNSVSLVYFKEFLEKNFAIILGNDLIEQICESLFQREFKFRSNFDKKKLLEGEKYKNVQVDVIEMKNKLIQISNC